MKINVKKIGKAWTKPARADLGYCASPSRLKGGCNAAAFFG